MFKHLEDLCGLKHSRTTPYHPEGNGQAERFNQTLLAMLRTLPKERKSNWADSLNKVVHAYNCTRNDATGFAPFFLLFGRSPRLPIDQIFGLCHRSNSTSYQKYVEQWGIAMKDAYEIVGKRTGNQYRTREKRDRKKSHSSALNPGDRVLVRNLSERGGPGKLIRSMLLSSERVKIAQYTKLSQKEQKEVECVYCIETCLYHVIFWRKHRQTLRTRETPEIKGRDV